MKLPEEGMLLRIFIADSDKYDKKPLHEAIVLKARELNLAGATVLRGLMGFGGTTRKIHYSKLMVLSEDLPLVVEIIDVEEKINLILPFLDKALKGGVVTLEKIKIISYRHEVE